MPAAPASNFAPQLLNKLSTRWRFFKKSVFNLCALSQNAPMPSLVSFGPKKGKFTQLSCEFAGPPCTRIRSVTTELLRSLHELLASLAAHSVRSLF